MSNELLVLVSAASGALVPTLGSVTMMLISRRREVRDRHVSRALDVHLEHYEGIFVAARSLQSAIDDYEAVSATAVDRFDVFLPQMLAIVKSAASAFAVSIDWRHNRGMYYLPLALETECLELRDQMNRWVAAPRLSNGYVFETRFAGKPARRAAAEEVWRLPLGSYSELRIITRRMVSHDSPELVALLRKIQRDLGRLISHLKGVIAQ
ncbi:MAG: hypothetical protein QOF30_3636 [Acidimicrobiaceae bacterium]|jgi:hypothetical protein|nr:hypothetical protein [Acidimicrobiaceae bacterium]